MKKIGIYVHIPFCMKKCFYCDFVSYCNKENLVDEYIKCLKKEIESKKNKSKFGIDTIYIGGGTPSFINENHIKDIIYILKESFDIDKETEITIEVNPGTVNENKFSDIIILNDLISIVFISNSYKYIVLSSNLLPLQGQQTDTLLPT